MIATEPFVLSPDVAVTAVCDLDPRVRSAMGAAPDDFAVTRRYSRSVARVVEASAADLLRLFRRPVTIAEAVIAFARERGTDPRDQLRAVFPFLQDCVDADFLVPADSEAARPIAPILDTGAELAEFTVTRCVKMSTDADVYEVRDNRGTRRCAKVARMPDSPGVVEAIAHEARVLARLQGVVSPRLIRHGVTDNRPYLVATWHEGVSLETFANEVRTDSSSLARRLNVARRIVDAYATLHGQGVLHADVHPGNLLVRGDGRVVLTDFALARFRGRGAHRMPRAGVSFFFEPEAAISALAGESLPVATTLGEQYAVAALLYRLFTGAHYADFSLKRDAIYSQIVNDQPVPFSARGEPAWPELEDCLRRALSKEPRDRFRSMADFANRLRTVRVARSHVTRGSHVRQHGAAFTNRIVERFTLRGVRGIPAFVRAPKASVNFGAAGIAYALYRMACARDEPELFALAQAWNARALASIGLREACFNDDEGITESLVRRGSFYHSLAGIHYVNAVIAYASADRAGRARAIDNFLRVCGSRGGRLDITLGRSGTLLACAELQQIADPSQRERLVAVGRDVCAHVSRRIESMPTVAEPDRLLNLGAAHGWAGVLYAIMRACDANGFELPDWIYDRLTQLADLATFGRGGAVWPWLVGGTLVPQSHPVMSGWCNGSAGFVYLWTLAHGRFCEQRFLELAEGAAVNAANGENSSWDLCCGTAGRAYALLHMWRYTRDDQWLRRAERLTARSTHAAEASAPPISEPSYANGLMRGLAGVTLLATELTRPDEARMPLFEPEPWPSRRAADGI